MASEAAGDSKAGNGGPITFFIKFQGSVKKVSKPLQALEDLYAAFQEKFPEDSKDVAMDKATFHTKDKKYGVEIALDTTSEVYDGAVIEVKVKGKAKLEDASSLKRQLEEMQDKLNSLQSQKRQRVDAAPARHNPPPPHSQAPPPQPIKDEPAMAVRMRGLPWGYKKEDVEKFLEGIEIEAILAVLDRYGRESGEVYVTFKDEKSVEAAKEKHKEKMGHRYIEIYPVVNQSELALARRNTRNLMGSGEEEVVLRLRGLPWQCTEAMVTEFFAPLTVAGINLTHDAGGRFKGECLVKFNSPKDATEGKKRDRERIGHRYIEIYPSSLAEWDAQTRSNVDPYSGAPVPGASSSTFIARMRGLPFSARESDIIDFFAGIPIAKVHIPMNSSGRPTGEGFVEVNTSEDLGRCLEKSRERIGHRYIEIFRSNQDELHSVMGTTPMGGHGGRGAAPHHQSHAATRYVGETFCLKMRGLPFQATEQMITDFFKKANVTPIRIHRKNNGGEGFVEFTTQQEQQTALKLHKEHMGRRYIELFPVSYEEVAKIVGLPLDPYAEAGGGGGGGGGGYPPQAHGYDYAQDPRYAQYYADYYAQHAAYDAKGYDAKAAESYAAYYGAAAAGGGGAGVPPQAGGAGGGGRGYPPAGGGGSYQQF